MPLGASRLNFFTKPADGGAAVVASGGDIQYTYYDGSTLYAVHRFNNNGTFTVTSPGEVDILLVGGGGGGNAKPYSQGASGGGGGGGDVVLQQAVSVTAQGYSITVGGGGTGGTQDEDTAATNGGNSTGLGYTAYGGNHGSQYVNGTTYNGGTQSASGGGGGHALYTGSSSGGTGDKNGGAGGGSAGALQAGGGGGAGTAGTNGNSSYTGGQGGTGIDYASSFSYLVGDGGYFAAGGNGGYNSYSSGDTTEGVYAKGGNAKYGNTLVNCGAGGGGVGNRDSRTASAHDGSAGCVMIRYPITTAVRDLNLVFSGTAQISTAQSKFGSSSYRIPGGTNNHIENTNDATFMPAGDSNWTIEFWYRPDNTSQTFKPLFGHAQGYSGGSSSGIGGIQIQHNGSNMEFSLWGSSSTTKVFGTVSANTWHHIAVVKNGTTITGYVDGSNNGNTHTDANWIVGNHTSTRITVIGGGRPSADNPLGYMDEFRISDTARYTTSFTSPTSAFSNDNNTVCLLHFEGSNGSTTIVDDYGQ